MAGERPAGEGVRGGDVMREHAEIARGAEDRPRGEHGDASWRRVHDLRDGRTGTIGRRGGDRFAPFDVVADVRRVESQDAGPSEADDPIPLVTAGPGARSPQHDHRRHGRAERDKGGDAGEWKSHVS